MAKWKQHAARFPVWNFIDKTAIKEAIKKVAAKSSVQFIFFNTNFLPKKKN